MNIKVIFNDLCKLLFGRRRGGFVCPDIRGRQDGLHELVSPYEATVYDIGYRVVIRLTPGFVFDGASVPRLLWFAAGEPMMPPRSAAALIHDWLYRSQSVSQRKADWYYAQIQAQAGRAYWRIFVEWAALRLCGHRAWQENAAKGITCDFGTITYFDMEDSK